MVHVLLIGHGAREHALAEALDRGGAQISAFMGKNNPAIRKLANNRVEIDKLDNFVAITKFGKNQGVNFAVVGPEAPLALGIVNALQAQGIQTVGPTIECAQLESSKMFMRELLKKYDIEINIAFQKFQNIEGIEDFIKHLGLERVVVKPDGLTGGKGVKVWGDHLHSEEDILNYCNQIFERNGKVIIEEKLDGEEFTYICFVDGTNVIGSPIVQDNKRAYNGDKGPNTGGMGSYSMANHLMPFIKQSDIDFANRQIQKVIKALKTETGQEYKGFLYGQFMKTATGIKLVEFNIRFGDPEAMNILPILKTNFVKICQQILAGELKKPIEFEKKATVCKYLVPEGYPTFPQANEEIHVDQNKLDAIGAKVYYASVNQQGKEIFTTTSRAIAILGIANSIKEAEQIAEQGTKYVSGKLFHRTDIGTQEVIDQRTQHMKSLLE